MKPSLAVAAVFVTGLLAPSAPTQDWTDEQLVAAAPGFQTDKVQARLQQVAKLLADRKPAFNAMVARIHSDHREYWLKIDRLLAELGDARWQVRENAERTLIEIGAKARPVIEKKRDQPEVLEQAMRCNRVLDALSAKDDQQEERAARLLRGLVATALYLDTDPRLLRALRSALGDIEPAIVDGAIRAMGKLGGDAEADPVAQMAGRKNGQHRLAAVSALARLRSPKAEEMCRQLLFGPIAGDGLLAGVTPTRTEAMAMVRALHARDDAAAKALLQELQRHPDPVIAGGAKVAVPAPGKQVPARFTLPEPGKVEGTLTYVDGTLGRILGDSMTVGGGFEGIPVAELSFGDCDTFDFPAHAQVPTQLARVFLTQGSLVQGEIASIDATTVRLRSPLFGELSLPRKDVQGIAFDTSLDRLVGASSDHDRVRMRNASFADGTLVRSDPTTLVVRDAAGKETAIPAAEVAGILFVRPRFTETDTTTYCRCDLVTGERLIAFVADSSSEHVALSVPMLGSAVLPWEKVTHVELGVGGGAMWGFTLIADYSDNRVVEVDEQGVVRFVLEEVYGAWDAECLDNGNLLITEFSVSRVQEVDRKGKQVWVFEDLKNPYDADRLPNGNTLIADTFASRVIEVDHSGKIVWQYAKDVRPFDCDRLPNGNTLIADVLKDRVIEVSPDGEIVWEIKGLPNAHDADRLPNGNTLVTLRNKCVVLELDRDGKVVFELKDLSSPSDADRLPNGNTIVAENQRVREFDRRGNEVWKKEMTWAVEVNRY